MHWLIQKHQKHFGLLLWTENTEILSVCSSTAFCLLSFKFPSLQTDSGYPFPWYGKKTISIWAEPSSLWCSAEPIVGKINYLFFERNYSEYENQWRAEKKFHGKIMKILWHTNNFQEKQYIFFSAATMFGGYILFSKLLFSALEKQRPKARTSEVNVLTGWHVTELLL